MASPKSRNGDIEELTERVADIFAGTCKPPRPRLEQCYSLAVSVGVIRDNKSYKRDFAREISALKMRQAKIKAFKKFVGEERNKNMDVVAPQYGRDMDALLAAIEKATPALLVPRDPLAGQRKNAWWHKAARWIALRVKEAMIQGGKAEGEISFAKGGPLVGVVTDLLKLAGIVRSPDAIANVLRRLE